VGLGANLVKSGTGFYWKGKNVRSPGLAQNPGPVGLGSLARPGPMKYRKAVKRSANVLVRRNRCRTNLFLGHPVGKRWTRRPFLSRTCHSCQILLVQYTKIRKFVPNDNKICIPKGHKIHKMAFKISNGHKIHQTFSIPRPLKIPNLCKYTIRQPWSLQQKKSFVCLGSVV
jgi:hypothetical protein